LKPLAIASYILAFLLVAFFIQFLNRSYYKRQKLVEIQKKEKQLEIKALENQRELVELKNKSLRQDIDNKNRELGISTMSLIKKNDLLNSIKNELSSAQELKDIKAVIKLINKNLNTSDDWKLFEEAFNNADKDFLKRIKALHSSLTSNDLRLCAYLRLNLSSKEIAPLLNISHRSVEVKRYRLRKKMDLSHEVNLSDYILEI
jgi:DNA-binding CsgD family transcriptional regulator